MAIQADLQAAGQPCRHPHVTQAGFFIHEAEVIVQAFAVVGNQIRLTGLFAVPRLVSRTGFHSREDAHQTGVLAPLLQQFLHPVFLPNASLADEFDFEARLGRCLLAFSRIRLRNGSVNFG